MKHLLLALFFATSAVQAWAHDPDIELDRCGGGIWSISLNEENLSSKDDLMKAMKLLFSSPFLKPADGLAFRSQPVAFLWMVYRYHPVLVNTQTGQAEPSEEEAWQDALQALRQIKGIPGISYQCYAYGVRPTKAPFPVPSSSASRGPQT